MQFFKDSDGVFVFLVAKFFWFTLEKKDVCFFSSKNILTFKKTTLGVTYFICPTKYKILHLVAGHQFESRGFYLHLKKSPKNIKKKYIYIWHNCLKATLVEFTTLASKSRGHVNPTSLWHCWAQPSTNPRLQRRKNSCDLICQLQCCLLNSLFYHGSGKYTWMWTY